MIKVVSILLVVLVISMVFTGTAAAKASLPIGTCAIGFELHSVMDPQDPMHAHIGLNADLNGDGLICMQIVTQDYCLITDNFIQ